MHTPQSSQADVRYDGDKFLKVTPNLFTAERLHLFDSMHLYTSLMKCSKAVEQGERLHNLSWRIVNKALLKDGDVNKSKKRDGVRNLYYVLNSSRKQQPQQQSQQQSQQVQGSGSGSAPAAAAVKTPSTTKSSASLQRRKDAKTSVPAAKGPTQQPPQIDKGKGINSSQIDKKKAAAAPSSSAARTQGTFYIAGSSPTPSPESQSRKLPSRQESLFGRRDQVFYSSDDDDSDWDGLSESDSSEDEAPYDDDEEEDSYYRRQWDKLLGKQPTSQPDQMKRSLLSGLFHHHPPAPDSPGSVSLSTASGSPAPASPGLPTAATGTTTVNAVGSVTSPQGSVANAVPPALYRESSRASRSSFSSIVSEATRERYLHESNAPPAAQTILPRALSTHMFPPNNVHQQRLAAQENKNPPPQARRVSMDIPGKKKNGMLKTRMEISEEEKFERLVKSYSRR